MIYQQSSIYKATAASEQMFEVGKMNPEILRLVEIEKIKHTFGEKLAAGIFGIIFQVKGCVPPRVYKIIPVNKFKNGDEIRISKIAAECGVAPAFHDAFLLRQGTKQYVAIEMDDAERSMGNWMEELAETSKGDDSSEESSGEEPALSAKEKAFREMMQAEMAAQSSFVVTVIKKKKRLSLEEAIGKMYQRPEEFYYGLFKNIRMLAERNIAYGDSHVGNIMPHYNSEKDMQLIDFDAAELMNDPQSAASESLKSMKNQYLFKEFIKLEALSDKSKTLIRWFSEKL